MHAWPRFVRGAGPWLIKWNLAPRRRLALLTPNQPRNLEDDSGATNPMESVPKEISFGDIEGKFESVDVRIPAGDYKMGTIVLQDNMILSLDKDGVSMTISGDADGPKARFTAGQSTEKGACSVGCNNNFWTFGGKKKDALNGTLKMVGLRRRLRRESGRVTRPPAQAQLSQAPAQGVAGHAHA